MEPDLTARPAGMTMDSLARTAKTLLNVAVTPAQIEMFRRYAEELSA